MKQAYNFTPWEADIEKSRVWSQCMLPSEAFSLKEKKKLDRFSDVECMNNDYNFLLGF